MPTPKRVELNQALRGEYAALYASCALQESKKALVEARARAIAAHKGRYEALAAATKVPWFVIGAIHSLECDLRFDRHLHNGDPLTARTVHPPRNRPPGTPPFAWEASALDALAYDGFTGWVDWTVPGMLYKLEGYNGFGYRRYHPTVKTPYLWSCTNHYQKGKYGADGRFDPDLVSQQVGVAAILRALEDLGLARIRASRRRGSPATPPAPEPPPPRPGG